MQLPAWLQGLEPIWEEWCGNREYLMRVKKVPFNDGVKRAALRKLERLRNEGYDIRIVMEEAVENGWRGFWASERTPRVLRDEWGEYSITAEGIRQYKRPS